MKEFIIKLLSDDETQQAFTKKEVIIYGVIAPIALVAVICLAGWMETSLP